MPSITRFRALMRLLADSRSVFAASITIGKPLDRMCLSSPSRGIAIMPVAVLTLLASPTSLISPRILAEDSGRMVAPRLMM